MAFWGVEVKPGKPYRHSPSNNSKGKLNISQATLHLASPTPLKVNVYVQCNIGDKAPVYLCAFSSKSSISISLNIQLMEEEDVILSVIGPCSSVHLVGHYLQSTIDNNESESYGEDVNETESEIENDDWEESYESSFIDDDELPSSEAPSRKKGKRKRQIEVSGDETQHCETKSHKKKKKKKAHCDETQHCETKSHKKKKKKEAHCDETHDCETNSHKKKKKKKADSGASGLRLASEGEQDGVIVKVLKRESEGEVAVKGKKVKIKYCGKIKESGEIFEFSDDGYPKKFKLGKGKVVKGLEMGIEGMRVGEKRRITVPPSLGYAEEGNGDTVPPNTWLLYEVLLLKVT